MTLVDVNSMFSTDDKCRELLKKLRWPNGVKCLRCDSANVFEVSSYKYECRKCAYQFTVTAQSIFHDSHLPLTTWFLAVLLIVEARKGVSANQLKRTLGVAYKTAWYLCHRIRHAMDETTKGAQLADGGGVIEMDETYVGGKRHGKRGRGAEGKEIVVGIREREGDLRFFRAEDVKSGTLAKYVQEHISADVDVIVTDDLNAYKRAVDQERHETVTHSAGEYVRGDIHTNTIESAFSLLKRGIIGSWHKVSAKHLPAYLNEMTFRFNRRKNSDLFVDTLRHMITADPLTFEKLTA
ncbi:MAG TPA: IS1595 family transposase [Bryobacteraceae bacterium]|nr:IS1595 family transposase [Bryobacteraceae bacterium]